MTAVTADVPVDVRRAWQRVRAPVLIAAIVLTVGAVLGAIGAQPNRQPLDPRDASPDGARALHQLLVDRGVDVTEVNDVDGMSFGPSDTVMLSAPDSQPGSALVALAASPATVVAIAPSATARDALGIVDVDDTSSVDDTADPGCTFGPAVAAGDIHVDGDLYDAPHDDLSCYRQHGSAALVIALRATGTTIVFGSQSTFSNDRLDERGDAALALGLLSQQQHLIWVLPHPATQPPADAERKGLLDLISPNVLWALLQIVIAVVVVALWRARRLGPVVPEPLPVVVRAVETVEGRARLLQAAHARGTAAAALRAATIARLREVLALGHDATRPALVEAVSRRSATPATDVDQLLYGSEPTTDGTLVELSVALDDLEQSVRRS